MTYDTQLVDAIKANFARKSTPQLEEIVRADDPQRWSPEAVVAAAKILQDRLAGRAQDPGVPEEELSPIESPPLPYSLGFLVGFLPIFALNGLRFGSEFDVEVQEDLNLPLPFGPRMAWLALDTTDSQAAASALDLRETATATWSDGMDGAAHARVFITPPLGDWTLAVSTAFFPPDGTEDFVKPLLERLSFRFGEVQYFCSYRDVELHIWARARKAKLVRGYGWLGKRSRTLWNEGKQTREEINLGFEVPDVQTPASQPVPGRKTALPNEEFVMQLASLWSIDPSSLDQEFRHPSTGLLGTPPWTEYLSPPS